MPLNGFQCTKMPHRTVQATWGSNLSKSICALHRRRLTIKLHIIFLPKSTKLCTPNHFPAVLSHFSGVGCSGSGSSHKRSRFWASSLRAGAASSRSISTWRGTGPWHKASHRIGATSSRCERTLRKHSSVTQAFIYSATDDCNPA